MAQFPRVAFMSYVHDVNRHDNDYLSKFRDRLEGELTVLSGEPFTIFQDRTHIHAGHKWEDRLAEYLSKSTLLLAIITPSYYNSEWCRKELEHFLDREQQVGSGPLVVPVYYISSEKLEDWRQWPGDRVVRALATYHYADWRKLRRVGLNMPSARKQLTLLATHVLDTFKGLEAGGDLSRRTVAVRTPESTALRWLSREGPRSREGPFDLPMLQRARRFVGRSGDLAWAIERLTERNGSRIVAIDGAQGIGKTAFAAEAVRLLDDDDRFQDGFAVVRCDGIADHIRVLRDALARFDPLRRAPSQRDDPGLAVAADDLLTGKDALIVLDDVEPALDIARVIEPLHRAGAALLLTSRRPLPLPDHVTRTLDALPDAEALDLLTEPLERRPGWA